MNNIRFRFACCLCALLIILCLPYCEDAPDMYIHTSSIRTVSYKVAVILPLSDSEEKARYESTVNWALENLRNAQKLVLEDDDTTVVSLSIEWYDESKENLTLLSKQLSQRDDILLTIGPLSDNNVNIMAQAFSNEEKALIAPCVTSEDIIRRYSGGANIGKKNPSFLWSLCETDVTQSEVMLATAWEGGAETVSLISPTDSYGKTFIDWVPFQASELGMTFVASGTYVDREDLVKVAQDVLSSGVQCVLCTVRSVEEAEVVLKIKKQMGDNAPRLLFSGRTLSASLSKLGDIAEGMEGIAPYADPETGFQIAYEEHFNTSPTFAEAQLYDAVLLAGFVAYVKKFVSEELSAINILEMLTTMGDYNRIVWSELGMAEVLMTIKDNIDFADLRLVGACGLLRFDSEVFTNIVESTYTHWVVYDGRLICIDYHKSDGSKRVSSTMASWNWRVQQQQTIVNEDVGINYSPLKDRYALLVQGSNGWENYRHQADVLNVYQLLKQNGWDDEHIILIISDDIAESEKNPFKGEVRANILGENLYSGITIDYDSDTLTVTDISDILKGNRSEHLPTVLDTDDQTNVLVFWSGHGCRKGQKEESDGFKWRNDAVFSDVMLREALETMSIEKRYRKMLLLFEPCYSEIMMSQVEGITGMLSFASSSKNESSFADCSYSGIGWMSDRFSNNIVKKVREDPGVTFYSFYSYLVKNTLGSHVHVANASMFGNLFLVTPLEFFK